MVTEQNPKGLGKTGKTTFISIYKLVPELELNTHVPVFPKMKFSMFLPGVSSLLQQHKIKSVVIAGIEVI